MSGRSKFLIVILGLWIAVVVLAVVLPHDHAPRRTELPCRANLEELGRVFLRRAEPLPRSGPALLIEYRQTQGVKTGEEETLLCPADQNVIFPSMSEDRDLYDALDLNDPASYGAMVSYAVRDFARFRVTKGEEGTSVIFACAICHPLGWGHERGVPVLYANGRVGMITWDELGVTVDEHGRSDGKITVVGPGSAHPELAMLIPPERARD